VVILVSSWAWIEHLRGTWTRAKGEFRERAIEDPAAALAHAVRRVAGVSDLEQRDLR